MHSNVTTSWLRDIAFGEWVFCAVGFGEFFTSSDTLNWTARRSPSTDDLVGRVRFLNGTFFSFGGRNIVQSGPVTPVQLEAAWSAGTPQITIRATPNLVFRLEASEQLLPAQWGNLGLHQIPASGEVKFDDTSATGHSTRFYRAAAP